MVLIKTKLLKIVYAFVFCFFFFFHFPLPLMVLNFCRFCHRIDNVLLCFSLFGSFLLHCFFTCDHIMADSLNKCREVFCSFYYDKRCVANINPMKRRNRSHVFILFLFSLYKNNMCTAELMVVHADAQPNRCQTPGIDVSQIMCASGLTCCPE